MFSLFLAGRKSSQEGIFLIKDKFEKNSLFRSGQGKEFYPQRTLKLSRYLFFVSQMNIFLPLFKKQYHLLIPELA